MSAHTFTRTTPDSFVKTFVSKPSGLLEEEYLRIEEFSPVKREFVAGYVYPLHDETLAQAGATSGHGEPALAIAANLRPFARKQGCKIYQADMWVNTPRPQPGKLCTTTQT